MVKTTNEQAVQGYAALSELYDTVEDQLQDHRQWGRAWSPNRVGYL
jgi:hypothetical protein